MVVVSEAVSPVEHPPLSIASVFTRILLEISALDTDTPYSSSSPPSKSPEVDLSSSSPAPHWRLSLLYVAACGCTRLDSMYHIRH